MQSVTVHISPATQKKLELLTFQTGESMQSILDKAVEIYRRQHFLERANTAFSALRDDPAAWQTEQEERAAWDATLVDDLEEE